MITEPNLIKCICYVSGSVSGIRRARSCSLALQNIPDILIENWDLCARNCWARRAVRRLFALWARKLSVQLHKRRAVHSQQNYMFAVFWLTSVCKVISGIFGMNAKFGAQLWCIRIYNGNANGIMLLSELLWCLVSEYTLCLNGAGEWVHGETDSHNCWGICRCDGHEHNQIEIPLNELTTKKQP